MKLKHMKALGDMTEASSKNARQGETVVARANSAMNIAMGECGVVCCFEGGLTPAMAAEVSIQKWWAKVSAGTPMAWANGVGYAIYMWE
jgi:hypothetical protein